MCCYTSTSLTKQMPLTHQWPADGSVIIKIIWVHKIWDYSANFNLDQQITFCYFFLSAVFFVYWSSVKISTGAMARRTAFFEFQFFPHVSKFTWTIITFIGLNQRNLTRKPFHISTKLIQKEKWLYTMNLIPDFWQLSKNVYRQTSTISFIL